MLFYDNISVKIFEDQHFSQYADILQTTQKNKSINKIICNKSISKSGLNWNVFICIYRFFFFS